MSIAAKRSLISATVEHLLVFILLLYISFDWSMCAFVVLGFVFTYEAKSLAWGTSPK